jgi:hypothetical protein
MSSTLGIIIVSHFKVLEEWNDTSSTSNITVTLLFWN